MIKLFLTGGNQGIVNSIASKIIARFFKKNLGLKKTKVEIKDLVIMDETVDTVKIHVNGDLTLEKDAFLKFVNGKLDLPD